MGEMKQIREEKGYTLQQVADKLSLTRASISLYENGKRQPSTQILLALSKLYNVSIDYLLGNSTNSVATTVMPLEQAREIFLSSLSIDQQEVISKVLTLTSYQLVRVQCYMMGLMDK